MKLWKGEDRSGGSSSKARQNHAGGLFYAVLQVLKMLSGAVFFCRYSGHALMNAV
nr:hypothetical protein [Clostridia bacterium]